MLEFLKRLIRQRRARLGSLGLAAVLVSACAGPVGGGGGGEGAIGTVRYVGDETGYVARPAGASGPLPAVVLIHEWWGLNDAMRDRADELAREGYVVLAVDMFDDQVATTPAQAQAQVGGLDEAAAIANLRGAVNYLRARPDVRADRVTSWGYCFGGGWSLQLLEAEPTLAACIIYYGRLDTDPARLRGLPPIQGMFGADDTTIPVSQVEAFRSALTEAGVIHEIEIYPGAGHAFAGPSKGERYRPEAAADAWRKSLAFLAEHGR